MTIQDMPTEDSITEIEPVEVVKDTDTTLHIQTGMKAGRMIRTMIVAPPTTPADLYV